MCQGVLEVPHCGGLSAREQTFGGRSVRAMHALPKSAVQVPADISADVVPCQH